ncbi:MAG: transcriptional regulator [Mesorhizobium sp.]|uniref:MucR family transcriptional regulator n=1 Tax=Mesorhizobium sp. TaxID=1871066 RepID=UPI000FE6584A|nr:MucR family transcriptional regulator [Mesorhizobium sp.]RWG49591.1 MAG: transcriptional regulator [Mesorhizobium sp.]RWH34212.1 MAG: transcriptional regulator [Mesorhizobium sp.]
MIDQTNTDATELVELTADIVSAFVSNNSVPVAGLADLISSVHSSLSGLGQRSAVPAEAQVPAVNPKKSVFPDYILCLEDGKKFKSLKRHLALHGLTPDEYRARWGLKPDYPMVAPNYAAQRSELAKASGLGRKPAAKPAKGNGKKRSTR